MGRSRAADPSPGWGDVQWRILMHLLKRRPTFASARELARETRLGHSKVADVVNLLVFHRALRRGKEGMVVEWDTLAKIMGALRLPSINPKAIDTALPQEDVHRALDGMSVPHVFGFTTAANALAYFEPHPETCVIVEHSDVAAVIRALDRAAVPRPPGRRSEAASRASPRALIFAEKLDRLDTVPSAIGTVTSLHQTYVDLLHFPLAGAHADLLRKAIELRWARERADDVRGGP